MRIAARGSTRTRTRTRRRAHGERSAYGRGSGRQRPPPGSAPAPCCPPTLTLGMRRAPSLRASVEEGVTHCDTGSVAAASAARPPPDDCRPRLARGETSSVGEPAGPMIAIMPLPRRVRQPLAESECGPLRGASHLQLARHTRLILIMSNIAADTKSLLPSVRKRGLPSSFVLVLARHPAGTS
jgi:hypothetical protein